ncbi:hypothetical protein L1N85_24980 [Paenibacillus alkaliterrae]|uniref:hypothetical protein n=1 Tax=Paenibacillus alkaliterrae TaxID=320909 RepID=UPI001F477856|nr:hypothetical protein [Paenibacillus alkaliterrae]MCF2941594.1 hypothetical protein [Paenibacillus alkaliterrae]
MLDVAKRRENRLQVNHETIAYVMDRFIQARVDYHQIMDIVCTMKEDFGVESQEEAMAVTEEYLRESRI